MVFSKLPPLQNNGGGGGALDAAIGALGGLAGAIGDAFTFILKWFYQAIFLGLLDVTEGIFVLVGNLIVRTPYPKDSGGDIALGSPGSGIWENLFGVYQTLQPFAFFLVILSLAAVYTSKITESFSNSSKSAGDKFVKSVFLIVLWWPFAVFVLYISDTLALLLMELGASGMGASGNEVGMASIVSVTEDYITDVGWLGAAIGAFILLLNLIAILFIAVIWVIRILLIYILVPIMPLALAMQVMELPALGFMQELGEKPYKLFFILAFINIPGAMIIAFTGTIVSSLMGGGGALNDAACADRQNSGSCNTGLSNPSVGSGQSGEIAANGQSGVTTTETLANPIVGDGGSQVNEVLIQNSGSSATGLGGGEVTKLIVLIILISIPTLAAYTPIILAKSSLSSKVFGGGMSQSLFSGGAVKTAKGYKEKAEKVAPEHKPTPSGLKEAAAEKKQEMKDAADSLGVSDRIDSVKQRGADLGKLGAEAYYAEDGKEVLGGAVKDKAKGTAAGAGGAAATYSGYNALKSKKEDFKEGVSEAKSQMNSIRAKREAMQDSEAVNALRHGQDVGMDELRSLEMDSGYAKSQIPEITEGRDADEAIERLARNADSRTEFENQVDELIEGVDDEDASAVIAQGNDFNADGDNEINEEAMEELEETIEAKRQSEATATPQVVEDAIFNDGEDLVNNFNEEIDDVAEDIAEARGLETETPQAIIADELANNDDFNPLSSGSELNQQLDLKSELQGHEEKVKNKVLEEVDDFQMEMGQDKSDLDLDDVMDEVGEDVVADQLLGLDDYNPEFASGDEILEKFDMSQIAENHSEAVGQATKAAQETMVESMDKITAKHGEAAVQEVMDEFGLAEGEDGKIQAAVGAAFDEDSMEEFQEELESKLNTRSDTAGTADLDDLLEGSMAENTKEAALNQLEGVDEAVLDGTTDDIIDELAPKMGEAAAKKVAESGAQTLEEIAESDVMEQQVEEARAMVEEEALEHMEQVINENAEGSLDEAQIEQSVKDNLDAIHGELPSSGDASIETGRGQDMLG